MTSLTAWSARRRCWFASTIDRPGATLKSIKILGRSKPRKLLIASTAPQIRYPDCYGIDMSELGKFIAFQAAVALIKERGYEGLLAEVAKKCREALEETKPVFENQVKRVYENFEPSEISAKVAELVKPKCLDGVTEVEIIYQSIENLHEALPDHSGDWYFTGDYPTGATAWLTRLFSITTKTRTGEATDTLFRLMQARRKTNSVAVFEDEIFLNPETLAKN